MNTINSDFIEPFVKANYSVTSYLISRYYVGSFYSILNHTFYSILNHKGLF